jgi:hypothetical protein
MAVFSPSDKFIESRTEIWNLSSTLMVILSYGQSHNLGNSHNHRDKIMKEQRPFVMLNSPHHFLIFLLYIEANTKGYKYERLRPLNNL